jgi:hypothetical protein
MSAAVALVSGRTMLMFSKVDESESVPLGVTAA